MLFRERSQPGDLVGDGAELASIHQVRRLVVDEVRGGGEFVGLEVVLDGVVGVTRLVMPACGLPVCIGQVDGRLRCVETEHVAEEVVIAKPGAGPVEADEQLISRCGLVQPAGAVTRAADGIDERSAHAIEHGGAHHPPSIGLVDLRQILVGEVVDHEAVVTLECVHEGVVVIAGSQRQSSEHQARRPSLGARTQRVSVVERDSWVGVTKQQLRFGRSEAERVGAHLDEL